MYLRQIQLKHTGPIENFDLPLPFESDNPKPVLLVGKNGCGKSTVISFIVNALIAMKQHAFDESEVEKGRVYRVRSALAINGSASFYFAKLAFDSGVTHIEWQLRRSKSEYSDDDPISKIDPSWGKIPKNETSLFHQELGGLRDTYLMEKMFANNCLLYFPADRFEPPDWLNAADLSPDLKLPEPKRLKGKTDRRIFSRNRLKPTLEWLNSVIFDVMISETRELQLPIAELASADSSANKPPKSVTVRVPIQGEASSVFSCIEAVLKNVLCEREEDTIELHIGKRKSRIISATIKREGVVIRRINDLVGLSAGESALVCLFASIIRDADLSRMKFKSTTDITGLVIVDEADMHLHVGLQCRALPELIAIFPKVQFVISAHAPMLAIGLENKLGRDGFEIVELPKGIRIPPESYSEFREAFDTFSRTQMFQAKLLNEIQTLQKPILLLEGKSDALLISNAWSKLYPSLQMPFEVMACGTEPEEEKRSGGAKMLRQSLEFLSVVTERQVCGIFDFDRTGFESFSGLKEASFVIDSDPFHKRHRTKLIHAILLPIPTHRAGFVNKSKPIHSYLSIEHYFSDKILKDNNLPTSPIVQDSMVFEIDANSKQKSSFSQTSTQFSPEEFQHFATLFERLRTVGFIPIVN